MNATFAIAVHNDDLPVILPLVPPDRSVTPCGSEWSIVSADIPDDGFDDGTLRDAAATLAHVSVFEAEAGEGRINIGNLDESPLCTYGGESLNPFRQAVLFEVVEGEWSNEIGRDETVNAETARNLFLDGETIWLSVVLREDTERLAETLHKLDSRLSPRQSAETHELL